MSQPINPAPARVPEAHLPWRLIAAGAAGNVMEWYDFAVYGYFAATIGKKFFPADNPTTSLIAAFGVFAAGFLMRPLGGIVFGHIGDHVGRKAALTISVLAMAIPTFLIGILPTHDVLGPTAAVLLVVLRLIQGLSVGGEYTTSIVFLVESSGRRHHGFAGSWSGFGATAGILLGSAVGAIITSVLPPEDVHSWGWRLPFLLGLGVGLMGLYVRKRLPEPPMPKTESSQRTSMVATIRDHWRVILRIALVCIVLGVSFYLTFVYLVTYMQQVGGMAEGEALEINTINMAILLAIMPTAGWLSDRVGRRPILLAATIGMLAFAWPLFWMVHHASPVWSFFGQLGFTILIGMMAVVPVLLVELAPAAVRCTVVALGYNLSLGLLGGTAPMAAAWLIGRTGNDLSPAFYLMGAAAISLVVILRLPETGQAADE
jgi:MHS family proline/betaine transporter-like MFS transporter